MLHKAAYTPGPWQYTYDGDGEPPSTIYAGEPTDEAFIATLCGGLAPQETFANARLIAAAPALAEALRRLLSAAQCRENTMGDPLRLIEVQSELRAAAFDARAALSAAGVTL